jgi:hypothetical protein
MTLGRSLSADLTRQLKSAWQYLRQIIADERSAGRAPPQVKPAK